MSPVDSPSVPHAASPLLRPCPACDGQTTHALRFRKNHSDILRCSACGLERAEPAAFDPSAYYTADYFSGGHVDGYSDYLGAESVLRREFARTVDVVRRYCPGGSLLELGCAYGFFLAEAQRHYRVKGIELAAAAVDHCRRRGLDVTHGVADEHTLGEVGPIDALVMLDVIEHLPEPAETLALCCQQLAPGGVVVLTTGDASSLAARLTGPRWRLMTPPQHLWYFTPESVRRLARRLGLSVVRVDHPWKIVPLSLVLFQLQRMVWKGGAPVSIGSHLSLPINLFDAMRVVLRKDS